MYMYLFEGHLANKLRVCLLFKVQCTSDSTVCVYNQFPLTVAHASLYISFCHLDKYIFHFMPGLLPCCAEYGSGTCVMCIKLYLHYNIYLV